MGCRLGDGICIAILFDRRVRPCFDHPTTAGILEQRFDVVPVIVLQILEKPSDALVLVDRADHPELHYLPATQLTVNFAKHRVRGARRPECLELVFFFSDGFPSLTWWRRLRRMRFGTLRS